MKQTIYQVDAFTDSLFSGNPAAVCPLENWLNESTMQNIAMENNLSETAFFVKENNHYHIRWFTPEMEVDLCGHATLASGHVLFHHYQLPKEVIHFHSRSGMLKIKRNGRLYTLDFPSDEAEKIEKTDMIVDAMGVTPASVWKGREDFMLVYNEQEEIEHLKPDFHLLANATGRGIIVTAPGKEVDVVSRFFAPQAGIDEDPVTGSAHTTLIPYWAKQFGKNKLTAKQVSKRGGYLICEYLGSRVEISGKAKTYMIGEIYL